MANGYDEGKGKRKKDVQQLQTGPAQGPAVLRLHKPEA